MAKRYEDRLGPTPTREQWCEALAMSAMRRAVDSPPSEELPVVTIPPTMAQRLAVFVFRRRSLRWFRGW